MVIFLCSGIPKSGLADLAKITKLYLGELCKLAKWDLDKLCKPLKPIYATYCNSSKLCIPLRLTLLYRHIKLANRIPMILLLLEYCGVTSAWRQHAARWRFFAPQWNALLSNSPTAILAEGQRRQNACSGKPKYLLELPWHLAWNPAGPLEDFRLNPQALPATILFS